MKKAYTIFKCFASISAFALFGGGQKIVGVATPVSMKSASGRDVGVTLKDITASSGNKIVCREKPFAGDPR
jgi:hypothetical protein